MHETAQPNAPWRDPRAWIAAAATATLACAAFTAAGAMVLLLRHASLAPFGLDLPASALVLRVLLFAALGLAAAGIVARLARGTRGWTPPSATLPVRWTRVDTALLAAALVVPTLLAFPNLRVYPWAAPDEVHHLNVAANLALHGRYASGSPQAGFRDFDPFDSVGPPVIVPVAAAVWIGGVDPGAARLPMAMFHLLLCVAAFRLLRAGHGRAAALLAPLLITGAFGSIYLARTLYGETPAFAFFLLALLAWPRAHAPGSRAAAWGLATGALLGVAILCKSILALSAFAFLAVAWWDLCGPRRIPLRSHLFVAAGVAAPLILWGVAQRWAGGDPAAGGEATLGLYAHYLLFGISPAPGNLAHFTAHPAANAAAALWLLAPLPALMQRDYDPVRLVLAMTAIFFLYWWIFFTPGQLPRYLWFSHAAAALLGAGWIAGTARALRQRGHRLAPALLLATMLPGAHWTLGQAREVFGNDEMRHDLALAGHVAALPADLDIATDFYPLRGTLRVFAGREVDLATPDAPHDLLITLHGARPAAAWFLGEAQPAPGRYSLWNRTVTKAEE